MTTTPTIGARYRHERNNDPQFDRTLLAIVESHGVEWVLHDQTDEGGYPPERGRLSDFVAKYRQVAS